MATQLRRLRYPRVYLCAAVPTTLPRHTCNTAPPYRQHCHAVPATLRRRTDNTATPNLGEQGRQHYHEPGSLNPRYRKRQTDKKFDNLLRTRSKDITTGTFFDLAMISKGWRTLERRLPTTSETDLSSCKVIPLGFEPKTHSLEGCCSIQLSYGTG